MLAPMDTRTNIYLSHTSALLCWQILGHAGLIPQTETCMVAPADALSNVRSLKQAGFLENELIRRLGTPLDLLVPTDGRKFKSKLVRCHVATNSLPIHGIRRVCEGIYVTAPELTFVQMGTVLTEAQLALVGMQLMGTYTLTPRILNASVHNPRLASKEGLARTCAPGFRMKGSGKARKALERSAENSNSPRESLTFLYLCSRPHQGGYGMPWPEFNPKIHLGPIAQRIARVPHLYPDLCWPEHKLILQYDSNQMHGEEKTLVSDEVKAEAFAADHWEVLTVRTSRLNNVDQFDALVRHVIAPHLQVPAPVLSREFEQARANLRKETLFFNPYRGIKPHKLLHAVG